MIHINGKKIFAVGMVGFFLLFVFAAFYDGSGGGRDDLAGVILAPPPDFMIVPTTLENPEMLLKDAAVALDKALLKHPEKRKLGLQYRYTGSEGYFLLDLENDFIQQTTSNSYGTVVQTTWNGAALERLGWCRQQGNFTPEGFSGPESRNLYH